MNTYSRRPGIEASLACRHSLKASQARSGCPSTASGSQSEPTRSYEPLHQFQPRTRIPHLETQLATSIQITMADSPPKGAPSKSPNHTRIRKPRKLRKKSNMKKKRRSRSLWSKIRSDPNTRTEICQQTSSRVTSLTTSTTLPVH